MLARGGAWAGVGDALADRASLVAPDLLGHGTAPDWDRKGGYFDSALADLLSLLTGSRIHLVGHSFGAVLALGMATRRPELVASLTLVEPVWFALAVGQRGYEANERAFAEIEAAKDAGDAEGAARLFAERWGDASRPWDTLGQKQKAYLIDRMPLVTAQADVLNNPSGPLGGAGFKALSMPVVLVEGAESPKVIEEILDALARQLPHARRVVIPDAGHMAPLSHPEEVADALAPHL